MFKDHAPDFFEKGLQVLPLKGKRPFTKDWVNHDFENDPNNYEGCNIGLKTGKHSGVICIDIDTKDVELREKIYNLLPPLYSGKVGDPEKGVNYFFSYNGEKNEKIGGVAELLSTGNQTVLPPSIHPEKKLPYTWKGKSLLEVDIDDLARLPESFMSEVRALLNPEKIAAEIEPSDGSRCNHGSHNKLSQMLVAAIHDGDTPDMIVKSLIEYDQKINETVSYFVCPSRKWRSRIAEINAYEFVLQGLKRHERTGELTRVNTEKVTISIGDIITKEKTREKYPHFRGIAQDMFRYVYDNSPIPRSRLACASVLSLMSITLANKVKFSGFYPNLYCSMIAPSGFGKDFPLKFPKRALIESGVPELIGQSMPASDTGIIKNLPSQKERIDIIDEASILFGAISSGKNDYSSKMSDVYASLYTSTGDFFEGKTLAANNKVIGACHSPYVSMLTAMTPTAATETMTTRIIDTGLGARFLFFVDAEKKRGQMVGSRPPIPKNIREFIKKWRKESEGNQINMRSGFAGAAPIDAKCSCPDFLQGIWEKCEDIKHDANAKVMALANRSFGIICKLALIDACSQQFSKNDITITESNLAWAVEFFRVNYLESKEFIGDHIAGGQREKDFNQIHNIIKNTKTKGITGTDLFRKTKGVPRQKRAELIDDLIACEMVFKTKEVSLGRPRYRYFSSYYLDKINK